MAEIIEHELVCWSCEQSWFQYAVARPGALLTVPSRCPLCGADWIAGRGVTAEGLTDATPE